VVAIEVVDAVVEVLLTSPVVEVEDALVVVACSVTDVVVNVEVVEGMSPLEEVSGSVVDTVDV
jgi:hypothetical protein